MFSSRKTSAPASGAVSLTKSLRFRSSASAYLNRTPASATNQKTWTWSGWIKISQQNQNQYGIFSARGPSSGVPATTMGLLSSNTFLFADNGSGGSLTTTQVFSDMSAWYHIVMVVDTTQATSTNRLKLYVNGLQVTSFSSATYPSQNAQLAINGTLEHNIGKYANLGNYVDGYMAEINFIDGQALTPSSFGATNATTGQWSPATYSGTYGTNGFHLTFANATSTTTLGYDTSGNSNNWTTNNISLTAGSTYDSMNDVPTLTSATASNYCVWNSNYNPQTAVITDGNLTLSTAGSPGRYGTYTTIGVSSGKFYWEITAGSLSTDGYEIGIANSNKSATSALGADTNSYIYLSGGSSRTNNTTVAYGATFTAGDVIGVAMDLNAGTLIFYKNGTNQGTAFTSIPSATWFPTVADDNTGSTTGSSFYANFGQQPFTYTPPSGYVSLNTYNLPTPSIAQGNKYMDATLYTGTGASQSITNAGSFKPDLVWIKSRSASTDNKLTDSVRGVTKALISDTTGAETTDTQGLTAFNSNGFTLGTDTNYNNTSATYVGWQWQAGAGSSSSNTNGSVTSTVSASTTAGFSIVNWTPSAGNDTVGHGLGVAPSMIIAKPRTQTSFWPVYHSALGPTKVMGLNLTDAQTAGPNQWNNTSPTSTVFSTASWFSNDGATIAYCFAQIAGFSAFGSYTGNGSTSGPFIYTGFQPKYLLVKRTDSTSDWYIWDSVRNTFNIVTNTLLADTAGAETSASSVNILSNGFQCVSSTVVNVSTGTYIYAAFASNPFAYSNAF